MPYIDFYFSVLSYPSLDLAKFGSIFAFFRRFLDHFSPNIMPFMAPISDPLGFLLIEFQWKNLPYVHEISQPQKWDEFCFYYG